VNIDHKPNHKIIVFIFFILYALHFHRIIFSFIEFMIQPSDGARILDHRGQD